MPQKSLGEGGLGFLLRPIKDYAGLLWPYPDPPPKWAWGSVRVQKLRRIIGLQAYQ